MSKRPMKRRNLLQLAVIVTISIAVNGCSQATPASQPDVADATALSPATSTLSPTAAATPTQPPATPTLSTTATETPEMVPELDEAQSLAEERDRWNGEFRILESEALDMDDEEKEQLLEHFAGRFGVQDNAVLAVSNSTFAQIWT